MALNGLGVIVDLFAFPDVGPERRPPAAGPGRAGGAGSRPWCGRGDERRAMSASGSTSEVRGAIHLIRLLAYLLILFAIVLENRKR